MLFMIWVFMMYKYFFISVLFHFDFVSVFSFAKCRLMQAWPPLCSLFHIYLTKMSQMLFNVFHAFFLTLRLSV